MVHLKCVTGAVRGLQHTSECTERAMEVCPPGVYLHPSSMVLFTCSTSWLPGTKHLSSTPCICHEFSALKQ